MTTGQDGAGSDVTIETAVEMFFGDMRLAPRSKKTYRHGINKFLRHIEQHEGIDPATAPVTSITAEHVTSFASLVVPQDIRTPEEVSQMRTAQNNLSAVRKFCAYIAAYDLHPTLATDRLRVRIAAMMPRFTPPPPDVKALRSGTRRDPCEESSDRRETSSGVETSQGAGDDPLPFPDRGAGFRVLCAQTPGRRTHRRNRPYLPGQRRQKSGPFTSMSNQRKRSVDIGRPEAMKREDLAHYQHSVDGIRLTKQEARSVRAPSSISWRSFARNFRSKAKSRRIHSDMGWRPKWSAAASGNQRYKRYLGMPHHKPPAFTSTKRLSTLLMSTRTHLDRTVRRIPDPRRLGRRIVLTIVIPILLVTLAGCASGTADDARRFESQEAESTQQVPAAQSTQLAEQFLKPTATPLATMTPIAGLSDLAVTTSVGPSGEPTGELRTVPAFLNQTIYLVARLSDVGPGAVVSATWRDRDNNPLLTSEVSAPVGQGPFWVALPFSPNGTIGPGIYSMAVYVNGSFLESVAFQVA